MYEYIRKAQYYETDQMGVIHHSNYIRWFEEARCALLASVGFGYDRMEREGIISPVLSVTAEYKSMVRFGDTVVVIPRITEFNGVRFTVEYTVTDAATGELRTTGRSTHCFINPKGSVLRLNKSNPALYETFANLLNAPEEQ